MRLRALFLILAIAGLGVVEPSSVSAHSGDKCGTDFKAVESGISTGFSNRIEGDSWTDSDGNEIPDAWGASDDYGGHCNREVRDDAAASDGRVVKQRIWDHSTHSGGSGDVSLFRAFTASAGQVYSASARMDLRDSPSGDFRAQIKIGAYNSGGTNQLAEWSSFLCTGSQANCDATDSGSFQVLQVLDKTMPTGTTVVKVEFRAKEYQTDNAQGNAVFDWVRLWRP